VQAKKADVNDNEVRNHDTVTVMRTLVLHVVSVVRTPIFFGGVQVAKHQVTSLRPNEYSLVV
jgi:hypothetical protein